MVLHHSVLSYFSLDIYFISIDSLEGIVKFYELCFIGSAMVPSVLYVDDIQVNILAVKVLGIFMETLDSQKQYNIEIKSGNMTDES